MKKFLTLVALCTVVAAPAFAQAPSAHHNTRDQQWSSPQRSELRYQAPIGARQPRPQDLPTGVLRYEGHATASQRNFDKKLEICRDCGLDL